MREQEYFLGFDIGTGSVGYAVTDLFYNLIKINRKYAWVQFFLILQMERKKEEQTGQTEEDMGGKKKGWLFLESFLKRKYVKLTEAFS